MIVRVFPYSIITDTDSICIFLIFIRKLESCAPDLVFRDFLFEVVIKKDVLHRFDTSHKLFTKHKKIYFKRFLEISQNFQYEATFSDNILVVGQKGCGKRSFFQTLDKIKIFGSNLLRVDWVSKINLTKIEKMKLDNVLPIQMLIFTTQMTWKN